MTSPIYPPLPQADLDVAFDAIGASCWRQLAGKRLFMTGATGFVGKWLLATLIDADRRLGLDCRVTALSRDPLAFKAAAPQLAGASCVEWIAGDVRDFAFPDGRFDVVVHAATDVVRQNSPETTFSTCVEGTRHVLDCALRGGTADFLLVSSGAVYGRQPAHLAGLHETYPGAPDPLLPTSAYGEGKRVSEWLACARAAQAPALRVKIARCFAFVGPYLPLDKHFAVGNFLRDAMGGDDILIDGDGTAVRSYLHAADMASWLWAILLRGRPGVAYNVGGVEPVSIAQLARRVAGALGAPSKVYVRAPASAGTQPQRYVPDVERARHELSLPEPIDLDAALTRTARWHLEQPTQSLRERPPRVAQEERP